MAAAMAELTCQNQELRMEINQRSRHVKNVKREGKHRVMLIEIMLKLGVNYEAPLYERCHT